MSGTYHEAASGPDTAVVGALRDAASCELPGELAPDYAVRALSAQTVRTRRRRVVVAAAAAALAVGVLWLGAPSARRGLLTSAERQPRRTVAAVAARPADGQPAGGITAPRPTAPQVVAQALRCGASHPPRRRPRALPQLVWRDEPVEPANAGLMRAGWVAEAGAVPGTVLLRPAVLEQPVSTREDGTYAAAGTPRLLLVGGTP